MNRVRVHRPDQNEDGSCLCWLPQVGMYIPTTKRFPDARADPGVYRHSLIIDPSLGMYHEISRAISIGSVKIDTSLLMMR